MADSSKISVASKLPFGLTVDHKGESVTLVGSNHPGALLGFGITHNVDKEWFDDWALTSGHDAVANGVIFENSANKIEAQVAEVKDDVVTKMEPLNPEKPAQGVEPLKN